MKKWTRMRYLPALPLSGRKERVTACPEHIELSKNAAREGMVLLKNSAGLLPLQKGTKLALFGKGTFDYVRGGGGSGDVTVEYTVDLHRGLSNLNGYVELEPALAEYYRSYVQAQYAQGREPGMIPEPELPEQLCREARAFTDTAVISISRFSGENWDRGIKGHELFENGDFYLSNAERAMVDRVKAYFPKIIVVMNVGGMVDSQWFACDEAIGAVLMAWQGGIEGGTAAAELLCGVANPCGKLTDTFARDLEDYPSTETFHESVDYVDYIEDIYVGYRYFETVPGAAEKVIYPFGFGLSYTSFDICQDAVRQEEGRIVFDLIVKNTGDRPGKEVVQVYVSAPQGKLGKAHKSLVGFQKTCLLQSGESQKIQIAVSPESFASYDDMGKVAKSAYVLEAGDYRFYVGSSVRDCDLSSFVYTVSQDRIVEQLSAKLVPNSLKKRLLSDGSYEMLPTREIPAEPAVFPAQSAQEFQNLWPTVRGGMEIHKSYFKNNAVHPFDEVAEGTLTLEAFMQQLTEEQLIHLVCGQTNTGVADTHGFGNIPELAIPNAMTADGPAGVRIRSCCGVYTTAFPCSTQLACTWDPELAYAIGQAGARELLENNLVVWLTPAVNIHRSPLCGRNFEYYSEDPFLTGMMAAQMVNGIQSQGAAPSVKHFAMNNKETNRKNSDSRVSERAAREIYLKPFEMIVKACKPWYVMSSYNLINGIRASENRELLTDILRGEWGFDGMVSSDWHPYSEQYKELKAGNDLRMPAGFPDRLRQALEKGLVTRQELEICAERILRMILRLP